MSVRRGASDPTSDLGTIYSPLGQGFGVFVGSGSHESCFGDINVLQEVTRVFLVEIVKQFVVRRRSWVYTEYTLIFVRLGRDYSVKNVIVDVTIYRKVSYACFLNYFSLH